MTKINPIDQLKNLDVHGTQSKWLKDNFWYKTDDFNHEGLAETIVSDLLKKSNIEKYAVYEPEIIEYKKKLYHGCKSLNFLNKGERLIESVDLLKNHGLDRAAKSYMDSIIDPKKSIEEFIEAVKTITGLDQFDIYLTKILELDMITLNPDRHFGNITVLKTENGYDYAPVFDNGRAFALCDDYWNKNKTVEEIIDDIESRPFSGIFSRQTKLIEEISGGRYFKTSYNKTDLKQTLDKCSEIYSDDILKRAEAIFIIQMERNIDYFITPEKEKIYENYIDKIKNKINDAKINIDNGDLIISRNNETPISFLVKMDKNVEVLKNHIQISDNELLFNYHEEFKFYRDLYYALNDYNELENSNIERLDR